MGKILRDIWILTKTGVTLFSRVMSEKINPQIFGGIMSALNIYAEKLTNGGISNFTLSNIRFAIIKRNNLLFIGNASSKIKIKRVVSELELISEKFIIMYPKEVLENWDSDVALFTDFKNQIDNSLENAAAKFQKSFW